MKKVIFDFSLSLSYVQSERLSKDVSQISAAGLRGLCTGRIFIFFEPQREYIILETGVLDYLLQLRGVLREIDSGNYKTFAVSSDYFSNNLQFTYSPQSRILEIYEANGREFKIKTRYEEFKQKFLEFFPKAMSELVLLYPELCKSQAFLEACK